MASAAIMKVQAAKRVAGILKKLDPYFNPHTGIEDSTVQQALAPQFFQHNKGAHRIAIAPDFGINELQICIEGEEMIFGIPVNKLRTLPSHDPSGCLDMLGKKT